jgi:rRNA maturation RNase YbeY|tara:strand:- start:700 stop:1152 length:453 start_codon:yes stop_codon:yes gene_type:complete
MKRIQARSQQRRFPIVSRKVQKATVLLMDELLETTAYDLSIIFVNETRMAKINLEHLQHEGATDIITFDYTTPTMLHGELIICPAVSSEHATHYQVTLGHEIARNIIHGVLHLLGYNDTQTTARKIMKRKENRLLQDLARRFALDTLTHG